jgi:hypothetical protein
MATTTNYGWTTPDDTALVKDGAAAIRTLGSSIDTTLKTQIDAQIPETLLTTTGDVIYASAANTPARLGIGTTDQVLKVSGGLPVWGTVGGGNLTETVFTSSNASWTIPTGVTGIWALVVGGGGGGGSSTSSSTNNAGGAGGAGQVLETYFSVVGDTTLNITVGAGGGGGGTSSSGGFQGGSGTASSIVGNTSATTYATAGGGGGGGGAATANNAGLAGASGGGVGNQISQNGGGGGGFASAGMSNAPYGLFGSAATISQAAGGAPTVWGVTGYSAGGANPHHPWGGNGVIIWNRKVAAGGNTYVGVQADAVCINFGVGAPTGTNTAGNSASANSGSGGNGGRTSATTRYAGGNGGSGLVVLRYIS